MLNLNDLVNYVKWSPVPFYIDENGDLFCPENRMGAEMFAYLRDNGCIDDTALDANELTEVRLISKKLEGLGFYSSGKRFVAAAKNSKIKEPYYIYGREESSEKPGHFVETVNVVLELRESLRTLSKVTFTEDTIEYYTIHGTESTIVLCSNFDDTDITEGLFKNKELLLEVSTYMRENTERRAIYVNELVRFLQNGDFKVLLAHFNEFSSKAAAAYKQYLSNFNGDKALLEVEKTVADFTSKLEKIISDAQTKVVTIPAAFVVAIPNIDFNSAVITSKDIGVIAVLFVFAFIMQLFLRSLSKALENIKGSIDEHQEKLSHVEGVCEKFKKLNIQYESQRSTICWLTIILWAVPIVLLGLFVCMHIK